VGARALAQYQAAAPLGDERRQHKGGGRGADLGQRLPLLRRGRPPPLVLLLVLLLLLVVVMLLLLLLFELHCVQVAAASLALPLAGLAGKRAAARVQLLQRALQLTLVRLLPLPLPGVMRLRAQRRGQRRWRRGLPLGLLRQAAPARAGALRAAAGQRQQPEGAGLVWRRAGPAAAAAPCLGRRLLLRAPLAALVASLRLAWPAPLREVEAAAMVPCHAALLLPRQLLLPRLLLLPRGLLLLPRRLLLLLLLLPAAPAAAPAGERRLLLGQPLVLLRLLLLLLLLWEMLLLRRARACGPGGPGRARRWWAGRAALAPGRQSRQLHGLLQQALV
jgi:hypothetical protein